MFCCNRFMILEEKFFLPPSFKKLWHEVSRYRCPNCNCIKVLQQWQTFNNIKQYEVTKKNAEDFFMKLKSNSSHSEYKVPKGTKGGMDFRYGRTTAKINTQTGITTFMEYSVDFNNTKELVRHYES